MQVATRKQSRFTSFRTAITSSWKSIKPGRPASSRWDLYLTCNELPLDRFIRCVCNEEYSQLVRTGTAPEHVLSQAWEKIYMEYVELDGSTNTLYLNQVRRDMMLLSSKIDRVITIVNMLSVAPNQDLIAELRKGFLFPYKYSFLDQHQYHKDLAGTIYRLAPWRLEYSKLEKELAGLLEANDEGAKVDRSYFDNVLARLSRYNRYEILANSITVAAFVTKLKHYLEYVEQSNRAHGKQRQDR